MHFRTAASAAILACAAHASAEPQPYKLAMMPVLGLSLSRRDTNGYQPEQSVCGDGNTCAEACGQGYEQCAALDESVHCFNPLAKQKCCQDGTGNSCDQGYYCTHDTKSQTWCCPDSMDLVQCAKAYNVDGGLETPAPSTSSAAPTSSTPEPSTTPPAPTTSSVETTSSSVVSTSVVQSNTTSVYETTETPTPISTPVSTIWGGSNSTISSAPPTQPTESGPAGSTTTTGGSAPVTTSSVPGSAAATGVSAALLLAAGLIALF
jgi:hypothetical protein